MCSACCSMHERLPTAACTAAGKHVQHKLQQGQQAAKHHRSCPPAAKLMAAPPSGSASADTWKLTAGRARLASAPVQLPQLPQPCRSSSPSHVLLSGGLRSCGPSRMSVVAGRRPSATGGSMRSTLWGCCRGEAVGGRPSCAVPIGLCAVPAQPALAPPGCWPDEWLLGCEAAAPGSSRPSASPDAAMCWLLRIMPGAPGVPYRRAPSMRSALAMPLPLSELRMLVPPLLYELMVVLLRPVLSVSMQRRCRQLPRARVTIGLRCSSRQSLGTMVWNRDGRAERSIIRSCANCPRPTCG